MKKSLIPLTLAVAFGVAASVAHAQVVITDTFDANFANFTAQNTLSSAGMGWSSDNGVGGVSGRINTSGTGNHTNAVFYSGAGSEITKNFTDTFTSTIIFRTGGSITSDIAQVSAGFIRSTGSAFNDFAGGYAFWGDLRNDGGGTYLRLRQTGGQVGSNSDTFSLTSDNWYALQASIQLSADATASSLSVAIFDVGPGGTGALGTALATISDSNVTLPNGGFSGNLWAGFGGGNNSGTNIAAFDNFSVAVVPEPATWGLILGSLSVGIVVLRRRRQG